jgi:hypothetical protein
MFSRDRLLRTIFLCQLLFFSALVAFAWKLGSHRYTGPSVVPHHRCRLVCMRQVIWSAVPVVFVLVPLPASHFKHRAGPSANYCAHHIAWVANAAQQQPRMTQSALHAGMLCEQQTSSILCEAAAL